MTIRATSTPEPYLSRGRGTMTDAERSRKARYKVRINNRCPVCGVLISPRSRHCRAHTRNTRPAGVRTGNGTAYTSRMYGGRLEELPGRGSAVLSIPAGQALCNDWGTLACIWCEHEIPSKCPALDGHKRAWCGACRIECACNGMKGREQNGTDK